MILKMRYICYLFIVGFLLATVMSAQTNGTKMAPRVSLKDTRGRTVRVSDFRGKIVMLNFWATWCVPCAAEVPELVKWQKKYAKVGLQIVGVTVPPINRPTVRNFARKKKMNYPVLFGNNSTERILQAA